MTGIARVPDDRRAGPLDREEVLRLAVEVVADHGVGGIEDVLRRPIVLLEQNHGCRREVAFELGDVADVGPAERVDRLVRVADDREARTRNPPVAAAQRDARPDRALEIGGNIGFDRGHKLSDEGVLRVVRVLVLIDEHVAKPPLVERRDCRVRTEKVDRLGNDVVEVERVRTSQRLRVAAIELEEPGLFRV